MPECSTGTVNGFPLTIKQNLFQPWATCPEKDTKTPNEIMRSLTVTTDLTSGLAPTNLKGSDLRTTVQVGAFTRIVLPGSISGSNSTLTYTGIQYRASPYISINKIQHGNLLKYDPTSATVELIWAFQKEDQKKATEDPQVILICRPAKFDTTGRSRDAFWDAVNASLADSNKGKPVQDSYTIQNIFPLRQKSVMYQMCITSKVSNTYATQSDISPFKIRVYVINDILSIPQANNATSVNATCPALVDYSLITFDGSNGPAAIVNTTITGGIFQFISGSSSSNSANFKIPRINGTFITDWATVKSHIEIQVPDEEYRFNTGTDGSLPGVTPRKQFKCYTIDPQKDIVGDQITIDPKTGQPLEEYMRDENYGTEGSIGAPGILPGDIEFYLQYALGIIGAIVLLAYLFYWLRMFILGSSDNPVNWDTIKSGGIHFTIWAVLLGLLIASEKSLEKKEGFTDAEVIESKDKRCYTRINSALIGTKVTIKKGKNADKTIISYTKEECEDQLGGYYKKEAIESGDVEPSSFEGPIGFCYTVDPKVTIPLSTQDFSLTICAPKQKLAAPKIPNRQCYIPSSAGAVLLGNELTLSNLGLDKFKPLTTIVSYTTDECNRLAGIYKKITVPSTFIKTDNPVKSSTMDIGFCYRSGSDLSAPEVDTRLNYSYTCSPTFSP